MKKKLILTTTIMAGVAISQQEAFAEENIDNNVNSITSEAVSEKGVTTNITSPTEYVADNSKDLGYKEIVANGTDGVLIIEGDNKVTRIEPTKNVVVVGTKPKIEEKIIEKATTEYIADNTKDYGTEEIVVKPSDNKTTEETTYKVITTPKYDFGDITEALFSTKYRYNNEKFWHIDNSQKLPSDKIVIDKLFIPIPKDLNIEKEDSIREYVEYRDLYDKKLTSEMLDPSSQEVIDLVGNLKHVYLDIIKTASKDIRHLASGSYISSELVKDTNRGDARYHYVEEKNNIKRYFASHIISDELYADAKADYLRFKLASDYYLKVYGEIYDGTEMKDLQNLVEDAFTSITQRYNNSRSLNPVLNIKYSSTTISEEDKKFIEDSIAKLPYEIRKNIFNLEITDEKLPPAEKTDDPVAIAMYESKSIKLNYKYIGNRDALLRVLLHELSHIIDVNGGLDSPVAFAGLGYLDIPQYIKNGFSQSNEYKEIYEKYIKNKVVRPYYRDNIEESFAEFFGQYIYHRIFGAPYVRFEEIDGKIITLRDYHTNRDKDEHDEETYKKYYDNAYSPVEEAEAYFASLYNKLFEQPTEEKVVIDTVTTTSTTLQNGKIILGTKPKETVEVIKHTTLEVKDDTLLAGERKLLQQGKDGQIRKLTTYTLIDKLTGEIKEETTEEIENAIEEIYAVGTKVVDKEEKDDNTTSNPVTPDNKDIANNDNKTNQKDNNKKETQDQVNQVTIEKDNQIEAEGITNKNKLPNTGIQSTNGYSIAGLGILSALLLILNRRKKQ